MPRPILSLPFLKRLLPYLLPLVLPLLVLAGGSILIARDFIGRQVATMTDRQLDNLRDMADVEMFEVDALNQTFSVNTKMISTMDEILAGGSPGIEQIQSSKLFNDLLGAQINTRSYVDSVYFYIDRHPERFLSVPDGIVSAKDYIDLAWLDTYRHTPPDRLLWTEIRQIRRYAFEQEAHPVFTIYRRLYPASLGRTGVIVMNIEKGHFDALLARASLFKGQEICLLDERGRLIIASEGRTEPSPTCMALSLEELPALTKRGSGRDAYYAYSSTTSRYAWRVVSVIPAASLEGLALTLQKLILAVLGLALLIGTFLFFSVARHDERFASLERSEREAKAEVLELKALRAQMNPHFLFNTLGSLYWMVYGTEGKPSAASTMIGDLSTLLKYSLEESEQVSLADEIASAERYLAIQQFRYKDKFAVEWDIDPASRNLRVVKFFLQPLLENSIYHGIRDREGPGRIRVSSMISRDRGTLTVVVEDDGLGIGEAELESLRAMLARTEDSGEHIGLHNTNRHIQLIMGEAWGIRIESVLGSGTTLRVRFPLLPLEAQAPSPL
jgi:two-component system sensor histidine kinase YesM